MTPEETAAASETDTSPADTEGSPTNLVDLMAELVPPPEPEPISMMPETTGWLVVAVLVVGLGAYLIVRYRRHKRAEAYRGAALAALDAAGSDPEAVARILRQTALTAFPREEVAGLSGGAWLRFLDQTCDAGAFEGPAGQALVTAPYRSQATLSQESLQLVRHWVSHHKREGAA